MHAAQEVLSIGGFLIVISFHSLEDRIVKNFLRNSSVSYPKSNRYYPQFNLPNPTFEIVTRKPITASKNERKKIIGTKILVINCLRIEQHISHFNLEEALEFIKIIKPQKAYLTHISHLFGTNNEIEKMLPENVLVAYDSLQITC